MGDDTPDSAGLTGEAELLCSDVGRLEKSETSNQYEQRLVIANNNYRHGRRIVCRRSGRGGRDCARREVGETVREFKFTEGPTCDEDGNVFFTDQPNNRIMKWSVDGKLSTFLQPAGRANGMYFDTNGNLIACADEKTELWSITPDKNTTVLAKEFEGKLLNGPNDVWLRPDGAMYFTDPFYKRDYWDYPSKPQDSEQVYYLSPDHKKLSRVTQDLKQPNGIIGAPDGKKLYVADIRADRSYVYDIQADGSLANKKLFCTKGSDGITLDAKRGDLYVTGHGVTVFDPTGRQIEHIDIQENWTANVSFGGKDHRTLFITASKGLYAMRMNVKGANPAK